MKIEETIKNNQVVLLLLKRSSQQALLKVCKSFSDKDIGIITSSIPAEIMLQKMKQNNVDCSHTLFVDCVSRNGKKSKQIIYAQGPSSLTGLSLIISKMLKSKSIDLIILDSISSLLLHNKDITLASFLHNLVNKIQTTNTKLVLTMLAGDKKGSLSSVQLFCDAVLKV